MNDTLFPFGQIVTSPGVLAALQEAEQSVGEFLQRHGTGDWGEVDEDHRQQNARALERGLRLLSIYRTCRDTELWCITEAGRSVTLLVLPEEYLYPKKRRPGRRSAAARGHQLQGP